MSTVDRLVALFRELPPGLAVEYLLRRGLSPLGARLHHYLLVLQPVAEGPLLPARRPSAFTIRPISEEEYRTSWFPRPESVIRARFAQGARCWVAFRRGEAVGCQWLVPGPYDEDEVRCRFVPSPPGRVAWDFDIYIVPELRLGRLFLQLWDTANAWMRSEGLQWSASRIDALNQASVNSHLRMGARVVGDLWFLSIGDRLQLARWPGGLHVSVREDDVPEVEVEAPPMG